MSLALNLNWVALFLGGTLIVGRLLGRTFTLEAPESGNPPDDVGLFFAPAAMCLLGLGVALIVEALTPFVRQLLGRWNDYQTLRKHAALKTAEDSKEAECPE